MGQPPVVDIIGEKHRAKGKLRGRVRRKENTQIPEEEKRLALEASQEGQ